MKITEKRYFMLTGALSALIVLSMPISDVFADAPSSISASDHTTTQITLSWTHTGLVDINFLGGASIVTGTNSPYTITGLSSGTSYTFTITAQDLGSQNITTSTIPESPSSLSATSNNNTQVPLTWTAPSGNNITDYVIQYSTDQTSWSTFDDGVSTSTSTTVTGLTNGQLYYFKVAAKSASGQGTFSTNTSATPATIPSTIADLSATKQTDSLKIDLSWSTPTNGGSAVTSYKIERQTSGGAWSTIESSYGDSSSTSYTSLGLSESTTYNYRISAINSVGTASASNEASDTTNSSPSQISQITIIPTDDVGTQLSWTAPSDGGSSITGYKIERDGSVIVANSNSIVTSYLDSGLDELTAYSYEISAINSIGISTASITKSVVTIDVDSNNFCHSCKSKEPTVTETELEEKLPSIESIPEIQTSAVPDWVRQTVGWWADDTLTDDDFSNAMEFLIQSKIIKIENNLPETSSKSGTYDKLFERIQLSSVNLNIEKYQDTELRISAKLNNEISNTGFVFWTMIDPHGEESRYKSGITSDGETTLIMHLQPDSIIGEYFISGDFLEVRSETMSFNLGTFEKELIPSWVKNNAKWWSEGKISEISFINNVEFLINTGVIERS
jgi:hypothetical protein|uniref:Fibronectin type III domain-containing protein n=1 Tax=uncultured marine thaumarchaeote KM3_66_E12 TaxID=1456229 RepID=A0A075HE55_9ARCH|nr:fibronectin type III domain-containing protein [uncultured marine thaumarchaeote KM3_66_E12]